MRRIAVWNGLTWEALSADTFDNGINAIEFYHNELYAIVSSTNKCNFFREDLIS